jgi:hypothetical protein
MEYIPKLVHCIFLPRAGVAVDIAHEVTSNNTVFEYSFSGLLSLLVAAWQQGCRLTNGGMVCA